MLKKIFFILVFINFTNCGFVPINSLNNNQNLTIQSIKVVSGDRKINMVLQKNLKRYQKDNSENPFNIDITTSYEKTPISKNTKGATTTYQLKATANFEIQYKNLKENISYLETFNIDHSNDEFENRKYEDNVKENFANSFSQKLISKLLSKL